MYGLHGPRPGCGIRHSRIWPHSVRVRVPPVARRPPDLLMMVMIHPIDFFLCDLYQAICDVNQILHQLHILQRAKFRNTTKLDQIQNTITVVSRKVSL
jgi:hypothetical protein